jgi:hypothetical protein
VDADCALTVPGFGHLALDAAARDLTDVGGRLPDSGRFTDAANVAVYLILATYLTGVVVGFEASTTAWGVTRPPVRVKY